MQPKPNWYLSSSAGDVKSNPDRMLAILPNLCCTTNIMKPNLHWLTLNPVNSVRGVTFKEVGAVFYCVCEKHRIQNNTVKIDLIRITEAY